MAASSASVWRHPQFLRLWLGQSVGLGGASMSALAVPLTAILVLHAGPVEVGLLTSMGLLPWLALGLPAGVWADRVSSRRLIVGADLARAFVLLTLPLATLLHLLRLELLYAVAAALGSL